MQPLCLKSYTDVVPDILVRSYYIALLPYLAGYCLRYVKQNQATEDVLGYFKNVTTGLQLPPHVLLFFYLPPRRVDAPPSYLHRWRFFFGRSNRASEKCNRGIPFKKAPSVE